MYNPDKMYEVPQISKAYCDKQDLLNSSLRSRYTVDLTTFSMRTPSPFKSATFKGPYVNRSSDLGTVSKFSLKDSETVQKDDLVGRTSSKSIHALQTGRGNATVETFGGREAPKRIPEESVRTWDSSTTINAQLSSTPSSAYQAQGYVFPGHEQQCVPQATLEKGAGTVQPSVTASQQDRVKTIVTLMGTIKLLESKNAALLNARKDVDAELEKVSLAIVVVGSLTHAWEQSPMVMCLYTTIAGALKKFGAFGNGSGPAAPATSQGQVRIQYGQLRILRPYAG
jgi:hypothetical protein